MTESRLTRIQPRPLVVPDLHIPHASTLTLHAWSPSISTVVSLGGFHPTYPTGYIGYSTHTAHDHQPSFPSLSIRRWMGLPEFLSDRACCERSVQVDCSRKVSWLARVGWSGGCGGYMSGCERLRCDSVRLLTNLSIFLKIVVTSDSRVGIDHIRWPSILLDTMLKCRSNSFWLGHVYRTVWSRRFPDP